MARAKKVVTDDEHQSLIDWVNEADTATTDSRAVSEKCRDYYDGKQWTDAEAKKLKAQKQAPTVINRIKPKVDGLLGMERTQRTTAKAFPRTPKHEMGADAATEGIRFVLQDNHYEQARSQTFEFINIEGTGGYEVKVEKKDFRITLNAISWDRIIYDPHCRAKYINEKTARYAGQYKWMDYDEAVEMYPDAKEVLESMQEGSDTYGDKPKWMDNTRRRVKIVELYYWQGRKIRYALFTHGGFVEGPEDSPFKNEEGEPEWPYEFASPFVDRDGSRYGSVAQYLDVQDEINKRRSKALHLMSVRQIAVFKGAVEDVNKLRAELAKPDGVAELTQPLNESFEVLKTGDMAAAQFNLLTEAKSEIDAVGYNAAVAGKDHSAISGVALKQRQMSGQTELAPLFDCLKHLDHRVYRKIWCRVKQYWKAEKWIRVTDDEQNLKWVGLNAPMTRGEQLMQQAQAKKLPPEQLQMLQQHIAQDPSAQEQVTNNDVAELDVDIIIDDAPDAVTTQIEDFQVLGEMVKSGFPIPPEAVILASPLSHKDRILKMMKERPQLPPEMQEKMKKMGEEMQKLQEENQALKANQQAEMAKLQMEQQKTQATLQLEQQKAQAELELERSKAEAELQLEREKASAELELEKAKAGAEADLQHAKISTEAGLKKLQIDNDAVLGKEKAENDKAVQEIKLDQKIDPVERKKQKETESAKQDENTKAILAEARKQAVEIAQAIVAEMQRPKTKTAKFRGETITVTEH